MTEMLVLLFIIIVVGAFVATKSSSSKPSQMAAQRYFYSKKDAIMTPAETAFYKRLAHITAGKYIVFPQIHLSALLKNETKGKYWKAAFQRINRTSVDYVLADGESLQAVYAVELDDWSHDNAKRRARDAGVAQMLADAKIPLVRFRNVNDMSDEDIVAKFMNANENRAE
ncbi:MAG: DUF2726 domain-containing protein [Negativicutes bacterium]|nr:DUF2726 domain-containing protein [Negativicutes bacterium]